MELRGSKVVVKRNYVINRMKRISGLMDAREYWNFVAGTALISLSVIGILCYIFV